MGVEVLSCKVEQLAAFEGTTALLFGGVKLGGRGGGLQGSVEALLESETNLSLGVSKLDGEEGWTVDAMSINGAPQFANGVGARYLRTKQVVGEEIVAALDAAAEGVVA